MVIKPQTTVVAIDRSPDNLNQPTGLMSDGIDDPDLRVALTI